MVFCCMALVGIAIIYFIALWLRQIFSWVKPDRTVSSLPGPPRALTGMGALPVYGHTWLFRDKAGELALDFDPQQLSIKWLFPIPGWNRPLGDCFSIFIWGKWRVAVKGPEATRFMLESQELVDSWPWSPPVNLLGKSCFGFLETSEREALTRLVGRALSHRQVQAYAKQFAVFAEKCLDEITTGQFQKRKKGKKSGREKKMSARGRQNRIDEGRPESSRRGTDIRPTRRNSGLFRKDSSRDSSSRSRHNLPYNSRPGYGLGQFNGSSDDELDVFDADILEDEDEDDAFASGPSGERVYKLKWQALRSYTFDIVDGPILNMNLWPDDAKNKRRASMDNGAMQFRRGEDHSDTTILFEDVTLEEVPPYRPTTNTTVSSVPSKAPSEPEEVNTAPQKKDLPSRQMMLKWMERMKDGVDVIKTTFGPEWMYIWMLNEYGRALNARMKLENIVREHVGKIAELIPNITHLEGHTIHDITTQPFPLLAMRENQLRQHEGIMGNPQIKPNFGAPRPRSQSAPIISRDMMDEDYSPVGISGSWNDHHYYHNQPYQLQTADYAAALRALDVVNPTDSEAVPTTTTSTISRTPTGRSVARRNRTESYPSPQRSPAEGLFCNERLQEVPYNKSTAMPDSAADPTLPKSISASMSSSPQGLDKTDEEKTDVIVSCDSDDDNNSQEDHASNSEKFVSRQSDVAADEEKESNRPNSNVVESFVVKEGTSNGEETHNEIKTKVAKGSLPPSPPSPESGSVVISFSAQSPAPETSMAFSSHPPGGSVGMVPLPSEPTPSEDTFANDVTALPTSLSPALCQAAWTFDQSSHYSVGEPQHLAVPTGEEIIDPSHAQPPDAILYQMSSQQTDDELTAATTGETDAEDIASVASGIVGSVVSRASRTTVSNVGPASLVDSQASVVDGPASVASCPAIPAAIAPGMASTPSPAAGSPSLMPSGSASSCAIGESDDDGDESIKLQLPEGLRHKGNQQARPHLASAVSNASTVQMKTSGENLTGSPQSHDDSDMISTTSTLQMLEDIDNRTMVPASSDLFDSQVESDGSPSTARPSNPSSPDPGMARKSPVEWNHETTTPLTPPSMHAIEGNYTSSSQRDSEGMSQSITSLDTSNADIEKDVETPVLERIMRQHDVAGNGVSKAVAVELSLIIWMMMDAGNSWTAMALSLLSTDKDACLLVQDELEKFEMERGNIFSPDNLNNMPYMDALIYEAIRLCPANLGGMKKTTVTVEMKDAGVQIPKGTNIFFCQPTDRKFNIRGALGKRPEHLGRKYPSVELHGFLPLHGLEVPLMVLQTKVFLISVLQKFTPILSLRKNFIRRVQHKVRRSFHSLRNRGNESNFDADRQIHPHKSSPASLKPLDDPENHMQASFSDLEACVSQGDVSQIEAMSMFTKSPFPEPRRVIHLIPRSLT